MRIPNAEHATIAPEKLRDYLLNVDHRRGGSKARMLLSFGYRQAEWSILERDLREQHLTQDPEVVKRNAWGTTYEIAAPIATPRGRFVRFRSIWQVDVGADTPRLITMFPD